MSKLLLVGKLTWSGVDLFFVLSGFLIGGILLDAEQSPHYFSTFYARRAYRILPLYVMVLGIYFSSFWVLPGFDRWLGLDPAQIPAWGFLIFAQNLWMAKGFGAGTLSPTWSLAIEEQFYLTMPWIVRRFQRKHLVLLLICVVFGAPLLRTLLFFLFRDGPLAAFVLMPCRADALSLGVLSAIVMRDSRFYRLLLINKSILHGLLTCLVLALGYLSYKGFSNYAVQMVTCGYSLLALFYTCCLLVALSSNSRILGLVLTSVRLRQLGDVSYCAYLIHVPLLKLGYKFSEFSLRGAAFHHTRGLTTLLACVVGYGLTLVIATISWHFVESPMLRKGHQYTY